MATSLAYKGPTYNTLYWYVKFNGRDVPSRFGPTHELLGQSFTCQAGDILSRKRLNLALGFMELCQVVGGFYDDVGFRVVAPSAAHNLFTKDMAYGPRFKDQMELLISRLKNEPMTRQAVLFAGDSRDEMSERLPCLVTAQFLNREGVLDAVLHFRSWDMTRGMPYDCMVFGGLLMLVARCLGLESGLLHAHAGSMHVYESAKELEPSSNPYRKFRFTDDVPHSWLALRAWAKEMAAVAPWPNKVPYGIVVTGDGR